MLRMGSNRYGNLSANQRRVVVLSDNLTPIISRKVSDLSPWQQFLLKFEINESVTKSWKRNCITCGRREKKESVLRIFVFMSE